jgi:hypothetical protein
MNSTVLSISVISVNALVVFIISRVFEC